MKIKMRKQVQIVFLLTLFLFSAEVFSQKEDNVIQVESQDDLGDVTDAFQENFFEALKQKAIENHDKAIAALVKCLAIDSSEPVVYLELGKNYNAMEKFDEAAAYLEKARAASPANLAILEELYQTYYSSKDFKKALPVVVELKNLNPSFSEDLANLYIINEEYEKALELLDSLDRQWGNSTYRNGLRHQVYNQTGNTDAYAQDLRSRIDENPQDEQNYLSLIYIYSEEGNTEKAFETARELQEMNPSSELVHLALYKFYLTEKNTEKAVESMKVIFRSEEIDEETKYKVLNDFLIFVAENPSLENDLIGIVQIFSENGAKRGVFRQLGNFFLELNQRERSLEFFEKALGKEMGDFTAIRNTLLLQLEFEKFQAAAELSEKAIGNYPSQPLLYLFNGTALNGTGAYKKAEEMLLFGLDYIIDDPGMEARFYEQLAVTYTGLREEKKAGEVRQKLTELKKQID